MSKIDQLVQEFVINLRAAVAEEAAAAFAAVAMSGGAPVPTIGRALARPEHQQTPKAPASNGKRSRRSSADIEKQAEAILGYVRKNPGSKAGAISKAVGMTSLEMQLPIGQLLSERKLMKKGERRATTYSAR